MARHDHLHLAGGPMFRLGRGGWDGLILQDGQDRGLQLRMKMGFRFFYEEERQGFNYQEWRRERN